MKRKNGFTLIELLAVIVILAIIALIATPTILGVVEKAKKGASKASALAYIDAIEKYMLLHEMDSTKYPYILESGKTYYVIPDSEIEIATISKSILPVVYAEEAPQIGDIYLSDFIEVKGEAPSDGYVVIGEKNTISSATFIVNNYEVTCENSDKCEVVGKYDSNIIKAKSVTINNSDVEIYVGETLQLAATVLPENTTNKKVKWTSSDETIATVDENGLVTAVKSGEVEITATTSNKKTATKNIKVKLIKLIDTNGNGTADIGETVTIGSENFYVISNDNTTVSMLAYYNLNAGGVYNNDTWTAYTNPTYRQDENLKGYVSSGKPYNGTLAFANSNGWDYSEQGKVIPTSYYSQYLIDALTNYDTYIKSLGANITSTRLITYTELINLGCSSPSCSSSGKDWLYSSSYWTGSAEGSSANYVWYVGSNGVFYNDIYFGIADYYGARPVLDISASEI